MKIYLASPFFTEEQIENVKRAAFILRSKGHDVYVPMENENREDSIKNPDLFCVNTFEQDVDAIDSCEITVALYYGNYSDSGTAWEIGYSAGTYTPIVVVHVHNDKSNLMVHISATANLIGIEELNNYDFNSLEEIAYHGPII